MSLEIKTIKVHDMQEYDVWSDGYGCVTTRLAIKPFVSDCDAPSGYISHEIRVKASNHRDARRFYFQEKRKASSFS